jgi:hypothetical protein
MRSEDDPELTAFEALGYHGPRRRGPVRVQRRRTKGWKMPPNTIAVTRPTFWGNPFVVGSYCRLSDSGSWMRSLIGPQPGFALIEDRTQAAEWFRRLAERWTAPRVARCINELGGKNLACWCPLDEPCHADVLLEIANR